MEPHPLWNHLVASAVEARLAATILRSTWGRADEHTVQQPCEAMGSRTSCVGRHQVASLPFLADGSTGVGRLQMEPVSFRADVRSGSTGVGRL